jgi:uncharacterized protein (DUF58 family)
MNHPKGLTLPAPAKRHWVSLDELLALRLWPMTTLNRSKKRTRKEGGHQTRTRGRGMEFDDVREYQPGDDIRHLDWRLMARTGVAHTKLYHEERERPAFILCDQRPSMAFATRGHFKSVLAAYAASAIAWSVFKQGDRVGGTLLTHQGEQWFKPASGRKPISLWLSELAKAQQQGFMHQYQKDNAASQSIAGPSVPPSTSSPWRLNDASDMIEVEFVKDHHQAAESVELNHYLSTLEGRVQGGSRIYMISDFLDLDESGIQHLIRLSKRCDLFLINLSDPLEAELPTGRAFRFVDKLRELIINANEQQRDRYQHRFQDRLDQLKGLQAIPGVHVEHWMTNDHPLFDIPETTQGAAS